MNNSLPICPRCKRPIEEAHGNRRYHESCSCEVKKERSKLTYAENMWKLDPFWNNEKILRKFYYKFGPKIPLKREILEEAGFDFDLRREAEIIDGSMVFFMRYFGFSILENETINLWKK